MQNSTLRELVNNFMVKPELGSYPEKPSTAESLYRILEQGLVPTDPSSITMYAMPSDQSQGYYYADAATCRRMTDAEKEEWQKIKEERRPQGSSNPKSKNPDHVKVLTKKPTSSLDKLEELPGKAILCFDTETTGVSERDEILQLTIVKLSDQKNDPEVVLSRYYRPLRHESWPGAMAVNHITPAMVLSKPTIFANKKEIQKIFEEADIITGYNVGFDIRMLSQSMNGFDVPKKKVLDVMALFKEEQPDGSHKLIDAAKKYTPEMIPWFEENAHDAKADAIMTLIVLDQIAENHGIDLHLTRTEKEDR